MRAVFLRRGFRRRTAEAECGINGRSDLAGDAPCLCHDRTLLRLHAIHQVLCKVLTTAIADIVQFLKALRKRITVSLAKRLKLGLIEFLSNFQCTLLFGFPRSNIILKLVIAHRQQLLAVADGIVYIHGSDLVEQIIRNAALVPQTGQNFFITVERIDLFIQILNLIPPVLLLEQVTVIR